MFICLHAASKNSAGKSREELALEKQMELERRLMDVSGQLNSGKKPAKAKRKSSILLSVQVQCYGWKALYIDSRVKFIGNHFD